MKNFEYIPDIDWNQYGSLHRMVLTENTKSLKILPRYIYMEFRTGERKLDHMGLLMGYLNKHYRKDKNVLSIKRMMYRLTMRSMSKPVFLFTVTRAGDSIIPRVIEGMEVMVRQIGQEEEGKFIPIH